MMTENAIVSANWRYSDPVMPSHECGRDKDRRQHQRDPDQRPADFVHRFDRRIARRSSLLDFRLDRFDHDDRIVDHQADRQHQAQERERVDRESDRGKEHESADQRYRNGQDRNQRRAPALQKDENHQHDQGDRLEQRLDDFERALGHRDGGVERQRRLHVRGKFPGQLRHLGLGAVGGFRARWNRDSDKAAASEAGAPFMYACCV